MRTVGLKTLKNKLSEYIRAVAAGETVVVTDRDRVVAEIVPPRVSADAPASERVMAELVREGIATPPKRRLRGPPPKIPLITFEALMADLAADREDR